MQEPIGSHLFESVRRSICHLLHNALGIPKLILTEGDLEARIFAELVRDDTISQEVIHIHSQLNYLKEDGSLGYRPDIVLLDPNGYDVDSSGCLFDRKGYTVWGSSIALELKLIKPHRNGSIVELVVEDLEKLKKIKDLHYGSEREVFFFGAAIVYCLRRIDDSEINELNLRSQELGIPLWLFSDQR